MPDTRCLEKLGDVKMPNGQMHCRTWCWVPNKSESQHKYDTSL